MRSFIRSLSLVVVLGLLLMAPVPAGQAQEPSEDPSPPEELAREGVEKLMRALDALIDMIPQYEMPQLNEDGDIIIKRKHDDGPAKPPTKPGGEEDDQTST